LVSEGDPAAPVHVFRDANGWHVEDVPRPADVAFFAPVAIFAGNGRVTVIETGHGPNGVQQLIVVERTSTGWGTPEIMGPSSTPLVARSPDGKRIALATPGNLWLREAGTTVRRTWFTNRQDPFAVGFGPGGKAWVLEWLDEELLPDWMIGSPVAPGTTAPAVLFEEL